MAVKSILIERFIQSTFPNSLNLEMLFVYLRQFPVMQYWGSLETYPWYHRACEGQGGSRVFRGRVSSKGTQGLQLLHPGAALWTVNCGGRTQRPLPATQYDDDDDSLRKEIRKEYVTLTRWEYGIIISYITTRTKRVQIVCNCYGCSKMGRKNLGQNVKV